MGLRLLLVAALTWAALRAWRALSAPGRREEEMVQCAACGTFVPRRQAASAVFDGERRWFCDPTCLGRYGGR
ncbi:MAG: hypothetical protein D6739_03915 [Nitrospirae bacterium]|nr:MAG: hypothetical protein D6739_03915 [Nitrospirota bacterium]